MSTQPDPQWEEIPAPTPETLTVKFREDQLSDDGRFVLNAVRGQSPHMAMLLQERGGVVYADFFDSDALGSDDVVFVRVKSILSFRERALKYGIEALDPVEWSGKLGPQGHPIPKEDYIDELETYYGEDINRKQPHRFEVPASLVRRVRRGQMGGAEAWNAFAEALMDYCRQGSFEIAASDDWITQTEAAELAGVPHSTIRSAVQKGQLRTWQDPAEANPQRRTRVSRQEVITKWG